MEENPVKSGSAISRKSSKIVPVENGEAEPKSKTGSAVSRKSTIVVSEATNDDKSETKSIKSEPEKDAYSPETKSLENEEVDEEPPDQFEYVEPEDGEPEKQVFEEPDEDSFKKPCTPDTIAAKEERLKKPSTASTIAWQDPEDRSKLKSAKDSWNKIFVKQMICVGDEGRIWFEQILWTLITLAMAIFCSASIPTIFHPYRNETIFTLADNAVPLNTIAHPAVTICSNNRISKMRYESFLNERSEADYAMYDYGNASDYRKDLKMVMEYAYKASHNAIPLFYEAPQPIKNLVNSLKTKLPDYMLQIMPTCEDMIIQCHWEGQRKNCSHLFVPRAQKFGVCCSFNTHAIDPKLLKSDTYSSSMTGLDDFLKLSKKLNVKTDVVHPNNKIGLHIVVDTQIVDYYEDMMNANFYGSRFSLHNIVPDNRLDDQWVFLDHGMSAEIKIDADLIEYLPRVRSIDMELGRCMGEEGHESLNQGLFPYYNTKSCLMACKAKILMKQCGCLPMHIQDFALLWASNKNEFESPLCDFQGYQCIDEYRKSNYNTSKDVTTDGDNEEEFMTYRHDVDTAMYACDCNEECTSTHYTYKHSYHYHQGPKQAQIKAYMDHHNIVLSSSDNSSMAAEVCHTSGHIDYCGEDLSIWLHDLTVMHFHFERDLLYKYWRDPPPTGASIIVSFGGLIGLASGFSLISLIEMIFWFIMKFRQMYLKKQAKKEKSHKRKKSVVTKPQSAEPVKKVMVLETAHSQVEETDNLEEKIAEKAANDPDSYENKVMAIMDEAENVEKEDKIEE